MCRKDARGVLAEWVLPKLSIFSLIMREFSAQPGPNVGHPRECWIEFDDDIASERWLTHVIRVPDQPDRCNH